MQSSTLSARRQRGTTEQGLVLRVQGSRHHGRLIRLTTPTSTIGSAEDCSLRLLAPGVGPCHCEILRRSDATRVRCLKGDTRLNGEPFDEATLSVHDRLSIGPIELEVVRADPPRPTPAAGPRPNRLPPMVPSEGWSEPLSRRPPLDEVELCRQLQDRAEQVAAQEAKLNAAWHRLEEERRQYACQQEAQQSHHQDPTNDIQVRLAELEARQTELDQQRRQWETERNESEQTFQRQIGELDAQRQRLDEERRRWEQDRVGREEAHSAEAERFAAQWNELEVNRAELDQQRRQWETERNESEAALQRQSAELETRLTELQSERERFEEQRQQWDQRHLARGSELAADAERFEAKWSELEKQRAELEQRLQQWESQRGESEENLQRQKDELAAQLAELQNDRTRLAEQRRQWEEDRAELDEQIRQQAAQPAAPVDDMSTYAAELPAADTAPIAADNAPSDNTAEPSTDDAPVDLDAVLARMGNFGLLRDEDPSDEPPIAQRDAADHECPQETSPTIASPGKETAEDESIQQYMAQLMQRIRGEKPVDDVDEQDAPSTPQQADVAVAKAAEPDALKPDQEAKAPPSDDMAPRAVAPEKLSGLGAMRELANLSARTAISRHTTKRMKDATTTKFVMAGVALVCGLVLLWKWQDWGGQALTFYSGLAALLTALICSIHAALLTGRLYVDTSGHLDWQTEPAEDETSQDEPTDAAETTQ